MQNANIEREYWDNAANDPLVLEKFICDPTIDTDDLLSAILPYCTGPNVLDLGCGPGKLLTALAGRLPGCTFYGVDISTKMLELAIQHVSKAADAVLIPSLGSNINLPDESIASIYCVQLFQHTLPETTARYIQEAERVLQGGGTFRFQFVEGDTDAFLQHDLQANDVLLWCAEAGLRVDELQRGLVRPEWTWITAVKP